jgi:hypothetical protein
MTVPSARLRPGFRPPARAVTRRPTTWSSTRQPVREGHIVHSRDYSDPIVGAKVLGIVPQLVEALSAGSDRSSKASLGSPTRHRRASPGLFFLRWAPVPDQLGRRAGLSVGRFGHAHSHPGAERTPARAARVVDGGAEEVVQPTNVNDAPGHGRRGPYRQRP